MAANYEEALKAEMAKVVRILHRYTSEQRASHAASFRLGHRQRTAVGSYIYVHPDVPGVCFDRRMKAAKAALNRA